MLFIEFLVEREKVKKIHRNRLRPEGIEIGFPQGWRLPNQYDSYYSSHYFALFRLEISHPPPTSSFHRGRVVLTQHVEEKYVGGDDKRWRVKFANVLVAVDVRKGWFFPEKKRKTIAIASDISEKYHWLKNLRIFIQLRSLFNGI